MEKPINEFLDPIPAKKWDEVILGGEALIKYSTGRVPNSEPVQSSNYKGGASGWRLGANGEVEIKGTVPASATAVGKAGTIAISTTHIYICTATNTWKRVAIATW
jgi:hypothetical protein